MIKRKTVLIFFSVVCSTVIAHGQDTATIRPADSTALFISPYLFFDKDLFTNNITQEFNFKSVKPITMFPKYSVTGMFCKMEHRIEATSNFAPRFRLGSLNYTDWMEGKTPFHLRYAK